MITKKLKKDARTNIRINSTIKDKLKTKGLTVQKIIDQYVNEHFEIEEIGGNLAKLKMK